MNRLEVLEIAILEIKPGTTAAFEVAIAQAFPYLTQTEGYRRHHLRRCLEDPHQYALLIYWDSLEAHLVNFRQSPQFEQWRSLIGSYFAQPPQVLHYQSLGQTP
ncbi:MAG: antibiotic biosynthesis monooxygenase [Cyanobacteriota bacterium]|nr:antibiotic biosynthesis monooxygenase [Cyanobacteriota bacterium]